MKNYNLLTNNIIILLLSLFLSGLNLAQASGLEASVDQTKITEGDNLIFSLVAPISTQDEPELSALSTDFDVISKSQSTNVSIINGNSTSTQEWRLELTPKHTGTLTIPAIRLGALTSEPLTIQVLSANQAETVGKARPVLIETEIDNKTPYIQSQVIYTARVLSSVPMQQASLSDPKSTDAIVEHLGDDTSYKTERNGKNYDVIERRYAIFPQRSGSLTIDAPVLSAAIPETSGRRMLMRDPFFGMPFGDPLANMGSPFMHAVKIHGSSINIEVKPQPSTAPSPWLPAKSLKLTETWTPDPPVYRVGDPVTRTITITAQGLSAAQLPNLDLVVPDGIKAYADQAQTDNKPEGNGLVANKTFKIALVPTQAGQLVLPEVRLPWWNTEINKLQFVSIPAHSINVLPAINSGATQSAPAAITPVPMKPKISSNTGNTTKPDTTAAHKIPVTATTMTTSIWFWISLIAAIVWLLTLLMWIVERQRNRNQPHTIRLQSENININKALSKIESSCKTGDPKAARMALIDWAAARWPDQPPKRLDAIAAKLHADVGPIMEELDRCLYAPNNTNINWDGIAAWRVLAPALNTKIANKDKISPLPPMYPY